MKIQPVDIATILVSLVALGGSLFAMVLLNDLGNAIGTLENTTLPDVGVGLDTASFVGAIKNLMLFGWVWTVAAAATSLILLYNTYRKVR